MLQLATFVVLFYVHGLWRYISNFKAIVNLDAIYETPESEKEHENCFRQKHFKFAVQ